MKITYQNTIICTFTIVQLFFTYSVVAISTIPNPIEEDNVILIEKVNPELIKNTDRKLSWKEKIVSKIVKRKLKKAFKKQAKSGEPLKRNGAAILSVSFGPLAILAFIGVLMMGSFGLFILSIILGALTLVFGILGLVQSDIHSEKYSGKRSGRGLATVGIILGIAFCLLLFGVRF